MCNTFLFRFCRFFTIFNEFFCQLSCFFNFALFVHRFKQTFHNLIWNPFFTKLVCNGTLSFASCQTFKIILCKPFIINKPIFPKFFDSLLNCLPIKRFFLQIVLYAFLTHHITFHITNSHVKSKFFVIFFFYSAKFDSIHHLPCFETISCQSFVKKNPKPLFINIYMETICASNSLNFCYFHIVPYLSTSLAVLVYILTSPPAPSFIPPKYLTTKTQTSWTFFFCKTDKIGLPAVPPGSPSSTAFSKNGEEREYAKQICVAFLCRFLSSFNAFCTSSTVLQCKQYPINFDFFSINSTVLSNSINLPIQKYNP